MTSSDSLALRCVLPGFEGVVVPDWLRRRAARGLGGAVLFARNVEDAEQLRSVTDALHAERAGFVVAIDEEGGDVTRLEARTGSSYPGNLALGAADDVHLTEEVAAAIGWDLAAAGVDLNLAPVADVNTNPRNPVIGVRSFGADPAAVARHTAAWTKGLQGAGVAACAKHFPGHGDTEVDSHLDVPTGKPELRPFEAAIEAGVRAIMSAHIVAPDLDAAPATISPKVMTGVLRGELGFKGLAISDGLDMASVSGKRSIAEAAVLAVRAGCDALCVGGGPSDEDVVDEIVAALVAGVSRERLAEAAGRVDALAAWRAANRAAGRPTPGVGLAAARRAICSDGAVQVRDDAVVIRFDSAPSFAAGDVPWGMTAALEARGVRVTERDAPVAGQSLVMVVRDLHRRADQLEAVEALLAQRPDGIVVEMGVPAYRPRGARAYVATRGSARVSAEAAAELMHP